MKLKRKTCSTGHGTGVLQERSLRQRLEGLKRRRRLRLGPGYRRGLHDERGRQVAAKTVRYYTHHRCNDPWALRELWSKLFPKPKTDEPKDRGGRDASVLERIREASTRKAAQKIAGRVRGASAGTRAKWARAIAAKAALIVLALTLTGCGLHVPLPCGWVGKCPEPTPTPTPTPTPPPADCRQIPGPEACSADERCVPGEDGAWHCVPAPPPPLDCQTEGCPAGERCELSPGLNRYECVPQPVPTPTPTPTPSPVPTPTPTPAPDVCPFTEDAFLRMGIALHSKRNCAPKCVKEGYLGTVYLWNSTPKSPGWKNGVPTGYCDHVKDPQGNKTNPRECELLVACQGKWGTGWSEVWMKHPAFEEWPGWGWMDHATGPDGVHPHPHITHHKAKRDQAGRTEIAACPRGVKPPHPKCSFTEQDIR